MEYAIKVGNQYFKEYIYHDINTNGRFAGIGHNSTLRDGDIIGIVTTDKPERTWSRRGLGGTIGTLYTIDKVRDKKIEIIPMEG